MTTTPTASPELPDLGRQFRKKPVVIEAVQWPGCRFPEPPPKWFTDAMYKTPGKPGFLMRIGDDLFIDTLEGQMRAEPGDWIIQGIKGEIYPCKPEIFEASYERVSRAQPEGEAPQAEPEPMNTQSSRQYLIEFMEKHFTDKTYHRYIRGEATRNALAGDFAWQMARALRMLERAPAATLSPLCGAKHAESGKEDAQYKWNEGDDEHS